jgi:recombination protein RecA
MSGRPTLAPPAPEPTTDFIPSGSVLLDLVLGGGWARGRIANIVGDRSSGKTLLAIEAFANFARMASPAIMRYAEAEAAFDEDYASTLGLPASVQIANLNTIEQFDRDLSDYPEYPFLYILDSLDALTDEKELERELGEASYGMAKAKMLSELLRKRAVDIKTRNATLIIISQIRDNIGVTFGETKRRAGGRALDFYASQIVWLAEIEKVKRTVMGIERPIGIKVLANNKKNKVGKPFRRAEFTILFNYGIDDETSMLDWLGKNKADGQLDEEAKDYRRLIAELRAAKDRPALAKLNSYLKEITTEHWNKIEEALEPAFNKYGR